MSVFKFNLDEKISLPTNVTKVITSKGDLFLGKFEPTWVLTDKLETKILEFLLLNKTPRETIYEFMNKIELNNLINSLERTLLKISFSEFHTKNKQLENKELPPFHIYITNECNFSCIQCYKNAKHTNRNELQFKDFINIVDEISELGKTRISYSGGEPLIKKSTFDLIQYTKEKGHIVNLVTNGSFITSKEIANKLAIYTDFLQISLDGTSEEINDSIRGKGTYKKIINSINLFEGLNKQINIGMTLTNQNIDEFEKNFENLYFNVLKTRPLRFNFSAIANYGRGKKCPTQTIFEKKELINRALHVAEKVGFQRKEWRPPHIPATSCGYAQGITIDEIGQIYYCPVGNNDVKTNFKIQTNSIKELILKFEQEHNVTRIENNISCNSCDLTYICGGGCRIENLNERNSPINVFCSEKKKEIIYEELASFAKQSYLLNNI